MAQEKIKFDVPDSPFPFIPPIAELLGWLGGPTGLHTPIYWLHQDLGLDKPDLKTLRKACQEGVTPRIAEMIEANIHQGAREKGFIELLEEVVPTEPVVKATNGTKWLRAARGLLEGVNRHQSTKLELPRTFVFLEQRSLAEGQLMLAFHRANNMNVSQAERFSRMQAAFCESCRHHTLLAPQEIQIYANAIVDANRSGQPRSLELVADALKLTFSMRADFYHQLLASFTADMLPLRETLQLSADLDDALVKHGAMGQLTPKLKQGKLVTPTYQLYELWRGSFSAPNERPLSYRTMALHLPRPESSRTRVNENACLQDILDAADETRRRQLKEWRSGTVPEAGHLTKFLESLTGKTYGAFLPFIMTRAATAWTQWIEHELARLDSLVTQVPLLEDYINFEWILEKFSQYPEYWQHAMAQVTKGQPEP
ncbi:hypothetical protein [Salinicola halophyticus]|uniref:hypothetical protein n=1 Tax=Salinicola halophyticus TaxID=1808881 RepID=UPI003F459C24